MGPAEGCLPLFSSHSFFLPFLHSMLSFPQNPLFLYVTQSIHSLSHSLMHSLTLSHTLTHSLSHSLEHSETFRRASLFLTLQGCFKRSMRLVPRAVPWEDGAGAQDRGWQVTGDKGSLSLSLAWVLSVGWAQQDWRGL